MDKNVSDRNTKTDIELVLRPKEGSKAKSISGMVDNRLFKGENKLHAIRDNQTCLWHLAFDSGQLPLPLKQQFTSFPRALKEVEGYYERRDVIVAEIRD